VPVRLPMRYLRAGYHRLKASISTEEIPWKYETEK